MSPDQVTPPGKEPHSIELTFNEWRTLKGILSYAKEPGTDATEGYGEDTIERYHERLREELLNER